MIQQLMVITLLQFKYGSQARLLRPANLLTIVTPAFEVGGRCRT